MLRVFISYSSKSKDDVSVLAQDITAIGHEVWFDHKLTGGKVWWNQILEEIRQCDLFIFALSPDALDSIPCEKEYRYAYSLNKIILPVLLTDGVSINLLPPELTIIQFVDYRNQDKQAGFKLMTALNNLPSKQLLPDPLPEPPEVPITYEGELKIQIESKPRLSFDEQSAIFLKLKLKFEENQQTGKNSDDILDLLKRFKKRDDLLAKIDWQIDSLIESIQSEHTTHSTRAQKKDTPSLHTDGWMNRLRLSVTRLTKHIEPEYPPRSIVNHTQITNPHGIRDWANRLLLAIVGWAIAGFIVSVLFIIILLEVMVLRENYSVGSLLEAVAAFLAGTTAGFFSYKAFQHNIPILRESRARSIALGFGVAWLVGLILSTLISIEAPFLRRLVAHIGEGGGITLVTILVLRKRIPAIEHNKRSFILAWGIAYVIMFLAYTLTAPVSEASSDHTLIGFITINVLIAVVINAIGGTVGCWLTVRALQNIETRQT